MKVGIIFMGMSKKDVERFNEIDLKALKMYQDGMTLTAISNEFDIKRQSLSKRLQTKFGITILDDGKKQVNENYFDTIDSDEKAYWLGFMFADGYVSKDNSIELCLKEQDYNHIVKFKDALKSKHSIGKKTTLLNGEMFNSYRISIKNTQLAESLKSIGCINNKSLVVRFPNIDKAYYAAFIRGFFEGDGSLYFDTRSKNTIPRVDFSTGSLEFAQDLQEMLLTEFNIESHLYSGRTCYTLRIAKCSETTRFLDLIYSTSTENTRLDRKFELYYTHCRPNSNPQEN